VTRQGAKPGTLFGAYDIRGRYPEDFPAVTCRRIADAFLGWSRRPFVEARDTRYASKQLERAVVARLRSKGQTLVGLGIQPTPVVGFASAYLGRVGLEFTPSHNAVGYAGIKAFASNGRSLGPEWGRIRGEFVGARRPRPRRPAPVARRGRGGAGPAASRGVLRAYLAHVTRGLHTDRSVVVDGRGGATTHLAPRALRLLGAEVRELHPRFSPVFHRLSPEPRREDVGDLGRTVRMSRADLGVAFDGDGDRVVFVDERGRWVEPEVIGAFLHRYLSPAGRPLVVSVDASQRCEAVVPTVRSRVGSRYVSAAMRRHRSAVGLEPSSHYYLAAWGPNSDGILTACVVTHLLEQQNTSLGQLARAFGPVVRDRSEIHFGSRTEAARRLRALTTQMGARLEKGIDGFVFRAPQGSVLLRLSNTQPTIRILLEPSRGDRLDELRRAWEREAALALVP
jgi:phosphoglucosamine mutase